MSVFSGTFPNLNWDVPYFHLQFGNLASTLAGISRALKVQGRDDVIVLGMGGDGSTSDIGLQDLSGCAHRNENILYVCYNNQGYENTGIQASGATPYGSWSTTTPVNSKHEGNPFFPKDVPRILIAHEASYVATASTGYTQDFIRKIEKAKKLRGFWLLIEYERGNFKINKTPTFDGLEEFLNKQGRFKHMTDSQVKILKDYIKHKYNVYKNLENPVNCD